MGRGGKRRGGERANEIHADDSSVTLLFIPNDKW